MMDYFFLQAIVSQLKQQLQGAVLNKVFQPQERMIILRFWSGGPQQRLLIDLNAESSGVYLTTQVFRNPVRPPRFCQLLRARLQRLLTIDVDDADRVLRMTFRGVKGETYTLIVELFGRSANMFLLDEDKRIVDTFLRGKKGGQRGQESGGQDPGQKYVAPFARGASDAIALGQLNPLHHAEEISQQWLLNHVSPMTHAVVAMFSQQAQENRCLGLVGAVEQFISSWQNGTLQPVIHRNVLSMMAGEQPLAQNLSDFAQHHYFSRSESKTSDDALNKAIRKSLKKLRQRLVKIEQQIDICLLAEDQRKNGDLLLANMHLLRRGMTEVTVIDYFQTPPIDVVIALDPTKTPNANAENYFKKYRKGKRGLDHCERRLQQTTYEIDWLQQIEQQVNDSISAGDMDIIRQELIDSGCYVPQSAIQRETRRVVPASLAQRDKTPNGWEIIWGNNNKTNDYVTKNLLKPSDLWLHAHNVPGCHLVIKNDGAAVDDIDLHYAATIAAKHSRAGDDSRVDVMVTEGKWVQRIKGAPLGLVKVKQYRVITVKMNG